MKEIHHGTNNSGSYLVVTVQPSNSRSGSPLTPSPSREIRGLRLFRAISRKLGRRSKDDLSDNGEDDSRSSSTDSCSSTSTGHCSRHKKSTVESDARSISACGSSTNLNYRSNSPHIMSSSNSSSNGSETGSETHEKSNIRHRHHHSSTAASLRKAFEHLTLSTRSHSCDTSSNQSNNKESKRNSKKTAPKRILRSPVTYTYVRGISGLPTQRIPRTNAHYYSRTHNGCYCGHQYLPNVHRY